MTVLLEIKEKMKALYAEFGYAIALVMKFILALSVFLAINKVMGYTEALMSIFPVLLLSLICCLLSVKTTVVFAAVMILGHAYGLGVEALGLTVIVLILLILFFVRFDEKDSVALLLTPLALSVGIPCFIPICFGLKGKPASAVSVGCGTFIFYYLHMLNDKAPVLQHAETADMLTNVQVLIDGILQSRLMIVNIAAMVLVVIVVYCLCRISLDYIWQIAIGAGAVVYMAVMLCGGLFLDIEISVLAVVGGTLIAVVLAFIMGFFVLNVDYSRTERMEFEDDEYYYYVKAVPKMTISQSQREIKTISAEDSASESQTAVSESSESAAVLEEYFGGFDSASAYENVLGKDETVLDFESKLEESLNDL